MAIAFGGTPRGAFPLQSHRSRLICSDSSQVRRYAVLGAGFAGVSVAWHLLQYTNATTPVSVELFDEGGIAAGASGASGGLLHPYSPKGKLLWKGAEGWEASLKLLAITEATAPDEEPFAWRRGILRPALMEKHVNDFKKNVHSSIGGLKCITEREAKALLPGLSLPTNGVALHVTEGINIDPKRYLEALWAACQSFARDAEGRGCVGTKATHHKRHISCLSDVSGGYEAVVVCLGGQAALLPELVGKLPLSMCRGVVAYLHLPSKLSEQFQENAPSLLSTTWLAFQGKRKLILGATKEWGSTCMSSTLSAESASFALRELIQKAEQIYPLITDWKETGFRAGMRAVPPRGELGTLPLVGCIDDVVQWNSRKSLAGPYFWLLGGFGSRGLIYHAWLGGKVAEAVISRNEEALPAELCTWKKLHVGRRRL